MVYRYGIQLWYTGGAQAEMTTARERYEAKTRVVTFRINQELYEGLEEVRKEAGLSFADIIKLGAGIAQEEIEKKLTEVSKLQVQLAELRKSIRDEQKTLDAFIDNAKKEQLVKLEHEHQIYGLFDAGWSTEEVRFKLRISQEEVSRHFKEWGKIRGERAKLQAELLKKCLQKHIAGLQEHIHWRATKNSLEEAKRQLEHCRRLLIDPSKLTEEERAFLIAEYSYLA